MCPPSGCCPSRARIGRPFLIIETPKPVPMVMQRTDSQFCATPRIASHKPAAFASLSIHTFLFSNFESSPPRSNPEN